MILNKRSIISTLLLLCTIAAGAQEKPLGYWSSLMPYNTTKGVATDGSTLFAVTNQAFFTYHPATNDMQWYSKTEGMSDIGMQCVGYDATSATAILVYANGNIDLFKDNTFFNIPDFKLKTIAGSKTVNNVYTEAGKAYLSSSQGILVIDLINQNVFENYQFYSGKQLLPVTSFNATDSFFYAATPNAVYRASKTNQELQNFQVWQKIDSTHQFISIAGLDNSLYLADSNYVYQYRDTMRPVFTSATKIININPGYNRLYISEFHPFSGDMRAIDTNFNIVDTLNYFDAAMQIIQLKDSTVWFANSYFGLARKTGADRLFLFYPKGPADATATDIYANNGELYIAHGGFTDTYAGLSNKNGFSVFKNGQWNIYREDVFAPYYPFADSMHDIVSICKDEIDGTIYAGSLEGGLFELHTDGSYKIYKQKVFDLSIDNAGTFYYQVLGTAIDQYENVWVTVYSGAHELYIKEKSSGNWYKFNPGFAPYSGPIVFDDAGDAWYVCPKGGGITGYNAKNTISDPTDDVFTHLTAGVGVGNLPNAITYCIAHDKNDNLWIGTSDGIGILYNASSCLSQHCDAEIPIVQYDQYAGYLFKGQNVRTIAVDGANRKWIGTDNGVWLLSPDAGNSKIIYKFTVDNSPLPSNNIQKIAVDKVTGDVYISTDQGLMCFRSTATDGGTSNSNVMTFPNPVPDGYKGTIAIKGLVTNADVRITDINGHLVYKTTALGGQAVWNGLDYTGHRPQSGVYLIFATNADGSETYAGKMIFMN